MIALNCMTTGSYFLILLVTPTSTFVALSFSSMTCLSIVRADLQASLNVMDYNSVDRGDNYLFCKG